MAEPSIERIRNATFPLSVRGYDRTQVDAFLAEIATWLETGGGGGAAAEEATRTALERVGEQTASILTEAHRAAEQIREDATASVRGQLVDANSTAEKVREEAAEYAADTRDEADAYARKVRGDADAYASRTTAEIESELAEDREAAKKEAERIVADANKRKADIESVIGDLEQRRDAVLAELDRLASGITGTASQHRSSDEEALAKAAKKIVDENAGSDPDETDDFESVPGGSDPSADTDVTKVIAAEKD
jgi:DivIVA domain-containing protein